MESKKDLFRDNLKDTNWLGVVVNNEDPDELGRIRVRVFGKYDDLEDDDIPWAMPASNISSGSASGGAQFSVPKINSIVGVNFYNGDIYNPEYLSLEQISDELKEEISGDSYKNAQSLWYDSEEDLKLFYTITNGAQLSVSDSKIIIKKDDNSGPPYISLTKEDDKSSININKDNIETIFQDNKSSIKLENKKITLDAGKIIEINKSGISLGSSSKSSEPALLGNKSETLFQDIITTFTKLGSNLTAVSAAMITASTNPVPVFGQLGWAAVAPVVTSTVGILNADIAKMNIDIKLIKSKIVTLD